MVKPLSEMKADPPDYEEPQVFERPDGFYWRNRVTMDPVGPFASIVEALADLQYNAESSIEVGESLAEAEAEIGVADWVDPETGQLAEESVPRVEDH